MIRLAAMTLLAGATLLSVWPGPVAAQPARNGDELLIVDCLLPGKVRRLGTRVTYLTARKAIKTTASECAIRGGEYTEFDRANYATALKIWLPLAQGGDPEAQTYLGEIYEKGLGVDPQYDAAAEWYRKAAEQGFSRAQIALGALYERGLGVAKDPAEAMRWYRRASGLPDAVPYVPANLQAEQAKLAAERSALEGERARIAEDRAALQTERAALEALRRELDGAQNLLKDRRGAVEETRRQLFAREQELELLRKKGGGEDSRAKAARLQQELQDDRKLAERQQRELDALRSRVTALNQDVGRLQVAVQEEQQRRRTEVSEARDQVAAARAELARLEGRGREAASELAAARASAAAGQSALDELRRAMQAERAGSRQDEARLEALQRQLAEREAELDRQRQRVAALGGEVSALSEQAAKAGAEAERLELAVTEERERRRREVGQAKSEAEAARTALARVQAEQAAAEQSLRAARDVAAAREADLASARDMLERERSAAGRDENRLAALQTELSQRERELAEQRQSVARLSGEVSALRARSAVAEAAAASFEASREAVADQAADAPPSIALLDPQVSPVRGVDARPIVKVNAGSERLIIGKVEASAGLLALIVNDAEQTPGANGVFRTKVALTQAQTPVNIVAIDTEGRRSAMSFALVQPGKDGSAAQTRAGDSGSLVKLALGQDVSFGNFHALVIGNNAYRMLPPLKSAVGDAVAVAEVLRQRYGFQVTLLQDADRYTILSALNKLRETLTQDDNLLIYYAGHGELDRVNNRGHWLPVDAEPDSSANWISNIQITDVLNAMTARQVMVVADSCYSGTLTRSAVASLDSGMSDSARLNWIKVMAGKRARVVLSSGGVQPVLDQGGGDHSVFANAFLSALQGNDDIMEGQRLFRSVSEQVASSAAAASVEQLPQFAPIKFAGHEAGDFFFVPRQGG